MSIHENQSAGNSNKQVFPFVLHDILEHAQQQGYDDVVSWTPCGRAFKIHHREAFVSEILPRFFKCTKYKSFTRQLNLWCFTSINSGHHRGSYSHPSFCKGDRDGCKNLTRLKIKSKSTEAAKEVIPTTVYHQDNNVSISNINNIDNRNFATRIDEANALITKDINAFMETLPNVCTSSGTKNENIESVPVRSDDSDSELEEFGSNTDAQNQICFFDTLEDTTPNTTTATQNHHDSMIEHPKYTLDVVGGGGDDWTEKLFADVDALSSLALSLDEYSFEDLLEGVAI